MCDTHTEEFPDPEWAAVLSQFLKGHQEDSANGNKDLDSSEADMLNQDQ